MLTHRVTFSDCCSWHILLHCSHSQLRLDLILCVCGFPRVSLFCFFVCLPVFGVGRFSSFTMTTQSHEFLTPIISSSHAWFIRHQPFLCFLSFFSNHSAHTSASSWHTMFTRSRKEFLFDVSYDTFGPLSSAGQLCMFCKALG